MKTGKKPSLNYLFASLILVVAVLTAGLSSTDVPVAQGDRGRWDLDTLPRVPVPSPSGGEARGLLHASKSGRPMAICSPERRPGSPTVDASTVYTLIRGRPAFAGEAAGRGRLPPRQAVHGHHRAQTGDHRRAVRRGEESRQVFQGQVGRGPAPWPGPGEVEGARQAQGARSPARRQLRPAGFPCPGCRSANRPSTSSARRRTLWTKATFRTKAMRSTV